MIISRRDTHICASDYKAYSILERGEKGREKKRREKRGIIGAFFFTSRPVVRRCPRDASVLPRGNTNTPADGDRWATAVHRRNVISNKASERVSVR